MGKLRKGLSSSSSSSSSSVTAPEALNVSHSFTKFDCGNVTLNNWLKERALKNESSGASRTYVICHQNHVIGYYTLATGAVHHVEAPGRVRRNMPDPIPVMVLGRLAVDCQWQKKGLGQDLLSDAVKRTLQVATIVGIRAIVVHAISDQAKKFYQQFGFQSAPTDPLDLMISLKDVQANLE